MLCQRNRVGNSTVWPRLDTGNSSVAPWRIPRTMAWKVVIRFCAASASTTARKRTQVANERVRTCCDGSYLEGSPGQAAGALSGLGREQLGLRQLLAAVGVAV